MITIRSLFRPATNEVWLKHAAKEDEKFWLVQPMQQGVRYYIKHSGEFLYKMSNEDDKVNFKVSLKHDMFLIDNEAESAREGQGPAWARRVYPASAAVAVGRSVH